MLKTLRLDEVCTGVFDCPHSTPVWTETGCIVLRNFNIRQGRLDLSEPSFTDAEHFADRRRRAVPEAGDIVITREAPMGEVAMIPEGVECCLGQRMVLLKPDPAKIEREYLLYVLQGREVQTQIMWSEGTGSTVSNLRIPHLCALEIPILPVEQQRSVGRLLRALDDKIELNRQMNETLEAMARALFRSWFVDFDPVRAKSEGRPTGLPADLDALFPSEFEDSPLGEIPKGWRAGSFGDEFYLLMGQSPPGDTYNAIGDGLPFFQGKTDFGFRFPSNRIYCSAPTRIAEPGQILISVRAPVGDVNVAIEKSAIGRGVAAAIHKSQSASYTLHTLTELRSQFKVFDGEGTVFGSINKADFQKLVVMVPSEEIVSCFEAMCQPLDDAVLSNEREIRGLAITRDELLPKLLNGEIEVADVEGIES